MGCALKLFQKSEGQKQEIEKRFLLLGLDSAGKTTILNILAKKENSVTAPTVGLNVESIRHKEVSVSLWDVGGAATLLWKHYYQDLDGVIFVIDSSNTERLDEAREELYKVVGDPNLAETPLLILGNKQDITGAIPEAELVKAIRLEEIKQKHKTLQMCSAKENSKSVWDAFENLFDIVMKITPK